MRKLFAVLALTLGLVSFASAQVVGVAVTPLKVQPVSAVTNAKDLSPALYIKFFPPVGGSATAITPTVATAATTLTFTVGGAAYTGFESPFVTPNGGIIVMSDGGGEANTLGEVVDIINSTPTTFATGYFRAAIANGLRSDVVSTLAFVTDAADTDVGNPDIGEVIYWDSDVLYDDEVGLFDLSLGASAFIGTRNIVKNPALGQNVVLTSGYSLITNGGTVGDATIYAVKRNYGSGGGCNSATDCGSGSEVVRTIIVMPIASTTAANLATYFVAGGAIAKDEFVFLRNDSASAVSTVLNLTLTGFTYESVQ
jgi:hypothetical protein